MKQPLTPDEEAHLRFLQNRYTRLDSDWSYSELCKYARYLERNGK